MQNDAYELVLRSGLVIGYPVFCRLYPGRAAVATFCTPGGLEPTTIDVAAAFVAPSAQVYESQFLLLPWALMFALFPTCLPRPEACWV
jgi:hypothetical protein